MLVIMHLYEGLDVYCSLIYSHNTHAADTSHEWIDCLNRASSAQAKRARVSSLHSSTKPSQRGLLSTGARASDLNPVMSEPYMSIAAFHGTSHKDHWEYG